MMEYCVIGHDIAGNVNHFTICETLEQAKRHKAYLHKTNAQREKMTHGKCHKIEIVER